MLIDRPRATAIAGAVGHFPGRGNDVIQSIAYGRGSSIYEGTEPEPTCLARSRGRDRAEALRSLTMGRTVVYAIRVKDGTIKIGCSSQIWRRRAVLSGELLGFTFGDFEDEKAIHATLVAHRRRGREYYHPADDVMAVVNDMRSRWNLPPLDA